MAETCTHHLAVNKGARLKQFPQRGDCEMTLLKSADTSSPQWEGISKSPQWEGIQVAAVGGYPGRRSGKYAGRRKVRYPGSHKERWLAWREGEGGDIQVAARWRSKGRPEEKYRGRLRGQMATDKVASGWWFPARSSEETDITGRCRREITKSSQAGVGGGVFRSLQGWSIQAAVRMALKTSPQDGGL